MVSFFFEDVSNNFTWYLTVTLTTDIVKHATNFFWSRFRTAKKDYIYPFFIFEKSPQLQDFQNQRESEEQIFEKILFFRRLVVMGRQLLPKPISCQSVGINSGNSVFCANHGLLCWWRARTMSVPQQLTITPPDTSTILSRWIRIIIFHVTKAWKNTILKENFFKAWSMIFFYFKGIAPSMRTGYSHYLHLVTMSRASPFDQFDLAQGNGWLLLIWNTHVHSCFPWESSHSARVHLLKVLKL